MARPDPWRLDPARYAHAQTLQTRFGDLDPLGHINNVAYATLFETGRVQFNDHLGLVRWSGFRWVMAALEINYLAEGQFPAAVEIHSGIGAVGSRSWRMLSLMTQAGQAIATCDAVLVLSDADTTIPDAMRTALATASLEP